MSPVSDTRTAQAPLRTGRSAAFTIDKRYLRAQEFLETAKTLWDAWDVDEVLSDAASGRYLRHGDAGRFEVHSDGHGLHQYRAEVQALTEDFVMGALFGRAL